jgi:hypothetical protein
MKQILGVLLIILGVAYFSFRGFHFTRNEKVLDLGPIQATSQSHESVPYSPILAGAIVVGGLVLVVSGARRNA